MRRSFPEEPGWCSGRRAQVAQSTRLAKHLGPNSRGGIPFPAPRSFPGPPREMFWATQHFWRPKTSPKNHWDVLGDGHRSLPALVYQNILGKILGDTYHSRRPEALPDRQGDILGNAHHFRRPDASPKNQESVLSDVHRSLTAHV